MWTIKPIQQNTKDLQCHIKLCTTSQKDLANFFPELRYLKIFYSNLKDVEKDDFKNLSKLVVLVFEHNALEILESDLFKYNPKLKYINFDNNKLKFIGADILKDLKSLEAGYFRSNPCVSDYETSISSIPRLTWTLRDRCPMPETIQKRFEKINSLKAALKTCKDKKYGKNMEI